MVRSTPAGGWDKLCAFACALAFACVLGRDAAANPPFFVEGKTLSQWTAVWWQWAFNQGLFNGPSFQAGTIDCSFGQTGPLWFLAGIAGDTNAPGGGTGEADRVCSKPIPKAKRLFFPLVNVSLGNPDNVCPPGNPDPPPGDCTVGEKRRVVDAVLGDTVPGPFNSYACKLSGIIDGTPVQFKGIPILRLQSPPFFIPELPPTSLADDPKAISDGYWVLLPVLPPGKHKLFIGGAICDEGKAPTDPTGVIFGNDVTYEFTVQ